MKRTAIVLSILLAALAAGCAGSPEVTKEPTATGLPPIIDRDLLFRDPELSGAQLSPDGKRLSFLKQYKDVRNVWVKAVDEPFEKAKPVTADERPVFEYFWSRDSRYILYSQDKGGNENWLVYAVDSTAAPEEVTGVPAARNLTPVGEKARVFLYAVPKNKPGEIIVGLNDRDPSYADVYRVDIATGKRELLIKNTEQVAAWVYDDDGNVRLATRTKDDGGTEILRVEGDQLTRIFDCSVEESCDPYQVDLIALMFLDLQTGKTELIESDPEKRVDFDGLLFAEDTDELMLTTYVGDRKRIYPKMKAVEEDLKFLKENLPDWELNIQSMTADMKHFLVEVGRDVDPGSVYLYDRANKKVDLVYRSRPKLEVGHLAEMKPVRYKARDGLTIPGYLTLPKGIPHKNLPVVLLPHGGPWARNYWRYSSYVQFLANRGYAVLQPNFRSSGGYGKKYLNAGNRTWGTGAMQHDLTDGVKWLIAQGIADPEKVCIFGGSYGGYATLAGVAFTPDLYKCGIPYVAVSNILTTTESFPAYFKPFLKTWYARVGDPGVEADREDMLARSPVNHVDEIKVPLLVVHGANDPRVKQFESDSIVMAVRDKGKPVEYLVAPDEGHGFRSPENRMAMAVAMEKFLAKHLGGRVQQAVPDKIAKRLAAITVDPKSVVLPDAAALEAPTEARGGR